MPTHPMRINFRESYHPPTKWALLKRGYEKGGFRFAFRSTLQVGWKVLRRNWLHLWLNIGARRTFVFQGEPYEYIAHKHNTTWDNERSVEIPIIRRQLDRHAGSRILEVGHVLGHYGAVKHDVLDRYENAPGVICQDVVTFRPRGRYDLVVSISTLEHIGFDEDVRDPEKIGKAIDNLCANCLVADGLLVFTAPLGYNPVLDRLLTEGCPGLEIMACLERTGRRTWREATWNAVRAAPYDELSGTVNAVVIGRVHASRWLQANRS